MRFTRSEIDLISDALWHMELDKAYDEDKQDKNVSEQDKGSLWHWRWKKINDIGFRFREKLKMIDNYEEEAEKIRKMCI